jgi:hypothetical protein
MKDYTCNHPIVRRINRKAAFLRFVDRHIGWGIAGCFVLLVMFFQWLDWPTGYPGL